MIIRFTKAEQEELDRIDKQYSAQINKLYDFQLNHIKNANRSGSLQDPEVVRADKEIRKLNAERASAIKEKTKEFEDIRFSKISRSPQKIKDNAQTQTKAIIERLQRTVRQYKPLTPEEEKQRLELLEGKTDSEILDMIEPFPDIFYDIIPEIETTGGETARLEADQIIDIIKKDLYRHYEKLSTEDCNNLDAFIEQAVYEALEKEPDKALTVNTAYFKIYHNKFIDNLQLMSNTRIQEIQETENKKRLYIEANGSIVEIKDWQDLNIQLGIPAHKLIITALSLLTKDTKHYSVIFPTKEFFEAAGYKIKNQTTYNTYVSRTNDCINTLRHLAILENSGKNGGDWIIAGGKADSKWIRITFHPLYAETLIGNKIIMQFPKALLKLSGQKSNAYFIGCKMALHNSIKNNVIRESNNSLQVETLLDSAEFPFIEDIRKQRASWIQKLRTPFETALDTLKEEGIISNWYYSGPKGKRLTPQERKKAVSTYETWSRTMIHFTMKDAPDMSSMIEKHEEQKNKTTKTRIKKRPSKK